eukprot:3811961-Prymnesium_polylepis.2
MAGRTRRVDAVDGCTPLRRAAGLLNAWPKPDSIREPSTSPKERACPCHTMASDQTATVAESNPLGSTRSTAPPAKRDVSANRTANPIDASTPYCASSKPTSRFMKSRTVSSLGALPKSTT